MISIDMISLLTTIYVLVAGWYQADGQALLKGKPGVQPVFSDSEMMTLFPCDCQSYQSRLETRLALSFCY